MDGVGPGSVLGGRYTATTRVGTASGTERWDGQEPELARGVSILVLPATDPRTAAVLDAARVAAGLDIPATVRILDIGTEGPVAYVVEESLGDASSVADLVRSGGLPGDEVRRISGEVATALETARGRGVHHLRITPDEVFRTSEGTVKVRGLAIAAALAGVEESGERAARTDALGVIALAYAGLTARWPQADVTTSLDPAPQAFGGVVSPSEITAGVPRDLDLLARMALSGRGGPTSPGDFARQIAPWSSRPIIGRPTLIPSTPDLPAAASAASAPMASPSSAMPSAPAPTPSSVPTAPRSPIALTPTSAPTTPTAGPALAVGAAGGALTAAAPSAAAAAGAAGAGVAIISATGSGSEAAGIPGSTVAAPPARPGPPAGSQAPAAPRSIEVAALEPPVPGTPAEPLTRRESRLALGIVAGFVLLALIVGINGVRKIGSQTDLDFGGAVSAAPTASAPASASAGALTPLAVLSADGFDPLGDNSENGQLAPRVFDGNPATDWSSEGYQSANLGGLKPGTGVILDLGPNVTPKVITLSLPLSVDVTVYVSANRSLDGATTVGQLQGAVGDVEVEVPSPASARQYVIIWFTNLSRDGDGFYRARLGEATVLG